MPIPQINLISGEPPPQPPQTQTQTPPKPNTRILSVFLIGVIMISVTALFFILLGLASFILIPVFSTLHRRHRRRRHRRHESSNGFSSRSVKKLPQFKFCESIEYGSGDCVVCLDGFKKGEYCRKLSRCGHVFHRKCVDLWLIKVATCPTCRARVKLGEEFEGESEIWGCFDRRRSSLVDL